MPSARNSIRRSALVPGVAGVVTRAWNRVPASRTAYSRSHSAPGNEHLEGRGHSITLGMVYTAAVPGKVTTTTPRELAPGLWDVEQRRRAGGAQQRFRMTIVRLADGGLWLYSPIDIDDRLAEQLAALGGVAHIVAPNRYHHLFAGGAKRRYPNATLWAVPGLPEKRRDLAFDRVLPAGAPWSDQLDSLVLTSVPRFNEAVFFHRASRTLICADFMFNIRSDDSFGTRLIYRILGVYGKPGQSWFFRKSIDGAAFGPQLEAVLAWNVQRICMSHGDVLDENAHAVLARITHR